MNEIEYLEKRLKALEETVENIMTAVEGVIRADQLALEALDALRDVVRSMHSPD